MQYIWFHSVKTLNSLNFISLNSDKIYQVPLNLSVIEGISSRPIYEACYLQVCWVRLNLIWKTTDKIPFYIYCCLKKCFGSLAVGCVTSDLICYLLYFHFGCKSHFDLSKSGSKVFYHFNRSKSWFLNLIWKTTDKIPLYIYCCLKNCFANFADMLFIVFSFWL